MTRRLLPEAERAIATWLGFKRWRCAEKPQALDKGLTDNHFEAHRTTILGYQQTMNTRVEKLGPGSWVVFVNGKRHHQTFLTRAAARREAKGQKETNKIDNES